MPAQPRQDRSLVHSIYLDREMLLSFLAVLTDGVALETSVLESTGTEDEVKAGIRAKLAAKLHAFFNAEMRGELESRTADRSAGEWRETRHYTHSSLLNDLRDLLGDQITKLASPGDLGEGLRGQFVEVTGRIYGNPLEQLVRFYERVVPYVEEPKPTLGQQLSGWLDRQSGKKPRPQTRYLTQRQVRRAVRRRNPDDLKSLSVIRSDLDAANVRDHLMVSEVQVPTWPPAADGQPGGSVPVYEPLRVVLTLSRDYLSSVAEDQLMAGRFTVFGKVTWVVDPKGQPINLARRATIGMIGRDALAALQTAYPIPEEGNLDPLVAAPAIQVMPIAIFI